ncbi:hypothetical protein ACWEC4_40015 [Streptomyces sp. NPDC005055]
MGSQWPVPDRAAHWLAADFYASPTSGTTTRPPRPLRQGPAPRHPQPPPTLLAAHTHTRLKVRHTDCAPGAEEQPPAAGTPPPRPDTPVADRRNCAPLHEPAHPGGQHPHRLGRSRDLHEVGSDRRRRLADIRGAEGSAGPRRCPYR